MCAVAWLRIFVMRTRVSVGQFGTTEYEARQLVGFLKKLSEESNTYFDPTRPLPHRFESQEPSLAPFNAKVIS
jgi:hypothetical protein